MKTEVKNKVMQYMEKSGAYEILISDLVEFITSDNPYTYEEVEEAIYDLRDDKSLEYVYAPVVRLPQNKIAELNS